MILPGNNKEQHIISLFAKGDTLAMDKLYGEYADYLAKVCLQYIGNREDMHDVLQEAFIRIFARYRQPVHNADNRYYSQITTRIQNCV